MNFRVAIQTVQPTRVVCLRRSYRLIILRPSSTYRCDSGQDSCQYGTIMFLCFEYNSNMSVNSYTQKRFC